MGSVTASDPLAAAALAAAVLALAIAGILFCASIVTRLTLRRRLALDRRAAALWNTWIARCTEQVPDSLPRLQRRDRVRFLLLWCRAQESLRGEAQDRLREMAHRLDAETHARRLLGSSSLQQRLIAVVALGHLRVRDFAPMLAAQVSWEPMLVSLVAAKALLRIDAASGIELVLTTAARRDDWPAASVANIVRECEPEVVGSALSSAIGRELAENRGGAGLVRLLHLHNAAPRSELRGAVAATLSSAAAAEALAAALAIVWHPQDAEHARRLLEHREWFVRAAAAAALGRIADKEDEARLVARLADPSWWVRYRAAQALCCLPEADDARLEALAATFSDRFARDMLRHALAERSAA